MTFPPPAVRRVRAVLACAAALLAACASAAEFKFSEGLSPEERAASGIQKLTAPQVAALDSMVFRDVTLARQGGVTGFSSVFSARHSGQERAAAGIDRLTDKECQALDRLAARAIAMGPPPELSFAYAPPKPIPPPADAVAPSLPRLEVHGDLSFTLGGGSNGRSFHGTSVDIVVTDPKDAFTVGVGFDEFRGKGLLRLCGPYGSYGQVYDGPPYLGW